jgi:hypothetical protein
MGRSIDRREADLRRRERDLDRREDAIRAREASLERRMEAAEEILAAADERDAAGNARDESAVRRETETDLARLLAPPETFRYGDDWPARRGAGLDRFHSKEDREASHDDRVHLTQEDEEDDEDDPGDSDPPST